MMDRRSFIKRLVGVAAVTVTPVYFFPPTGGWTCLESGVWANNYPGTSIWSSKTPAEIMADINALLETTWKTAIVPEVLLIPPMPGEVLTQRHRRFGDSQ